MSTTDSVTSSRLRPHASHLVVQIGYFAVVAVIAALLIYGAQVLFVPLLLSLILTLVLDPLVNWFETRGMKRMHVIVGLSAFACMIAGVLFVFLVPALVHEIELIAHNMPKYQASAAQGLASIQQLLQTMLPGIKIPDLLTLIQQQMPKNSAVNVGAVMGYLSSLASLVSLLVLVPIITFFFLADGHLIHRLILSMVPNTYFEMTVLLIDRIITQIRLFIRGQMLDLLYVGVTVGIGLWIVGVPYASVIGIIAGLGNMVPYLGPVIGFVPALAVLIMSPEGLTALPVLKVLAVFFFVQFTENNFVYPLVVGKSVELHPLVVILGVIVGGTLGGVVGMLLTVPVIGVVKVAIEVVHFYLKSYEII